MKLTVLGCGTSGGVPRLGGPDGAGDWGNCDPDNPLNRRTRASAVIEAGGTRILIDTGPDLHSQLLSTRIGTIDAVVWTHTHADHCHGIDDLRTLRHIRGSPIPALGVSATISELRRRFSYVFEGQFGYPSVCEPRTIGKVAMVANIAIKTVEQPHGPVWSSGLRFDHDGRSIGYAIDFSEITEAMVSLYRGCDVMVIDCLRERPHPTHSHLAMALDLAKRAGIGRALLSHMDSSLDHKHLSAKLPPNVVPAHDGIVVEVA